MVGSIGSVVLFVVGVVVITFEVGVLEVVVLNLVEDLVIVCEILVLSV